MIAQCVRGGKEALDSSLREEACVYVCAMYAAEEGSGTLFLIVNIIFNQFNKANHHQSPSSNVAITFRIPEKSSEPPTFIIHEPRTPPINTR